MKITLTATIEFPPSTKGVDLNAYAASVANRICKMVQSDADLPNHVGCYVEWEFEYSRPEQVAPKDYDRKDWN